jgi:O-antigen biosynthesis protein WbqV
MAPQRVLISDQSRGVDLAVTARALGLTVGYLPTLTPVLNPKEVHHLHAQLTPQDLLRRPAIALNRSEVAALIANKRVLLTGAGGSIGSELVQQIAAYAPKQLILVDISEYNLYAIDMELRERFPSIEHRIALCDVKIRSDIMQLFERCRPELVFHAAALKHVPIGEHNPIATMLTNAIGTRNVADAALKVGALAMVQISTDKAVNPTSIMGASKRLSEYYTQALELACTAANNHSGSTRFVTVRFGNVLNSSGSVVPLFQKQLASGGPITVTHPDVKRYFMTIAEAVGLVLQASAYGIQQSAERGRILVLDMGDPVPIVEVARQMISLAGYKQSEIQIEFIGLRPGEKLDEELFDPSENLLETDIAGVLSAQPIPMPLESINGILDEIQEFASRGDEAGLRNFVEPLIPGCRLGRLQGHVAMPISESLTADGWEGSDRESISLDAATARTVGAR